METCYIARLEKNQSLVKIEDNAFKHIKALRLQVGDKIDLTSGKGFLAETIVEKIEKHYCENRILNFIDNVSENSFNLTLAIGILDSSDRFEFALEKAVELGATRIIPLKSKFTQKKAIRKDRLETKLIAAMEQSKRCVLTLLDEPKTVAEALNGLESNSKIILGDIDGEKPNLNADSDITVFIGPEGGFSNDEIDLIKSNKNCSLWKLANSRLRAESAAISALATINSLLI